MNGLQEQLRVADRNPFSDEINVFRSHFSSDPSLVGDVVGSAIERVTPMLATPDDLQGLEIALIEILNNICEHAYGGDVLRPVELEIWQQGGQLKFCIRDRGAEMPGQKLPAGDRANTEVGHADMPEGGFGWFLIRTLVRDLHYDRLGGENCLTFRMGCHIKADREMSLE